jgi:hypothetical protein
MSIASDAPAAHTPSVMRSALLRRKIKGRCIRSSVSSGAGSYGKRRKVSITISLRRHATSGGGGRESEERSSRGYQEILHAGAAMLRTARSGGVSAMLHRTTVRRADLIEGTVDSLAIGAVADVIRESFGPCDSSAEKREDFGWDLFSLHRHFAEPAGAILPFRFRQRRAADDDSRSIFRCPR